MRALRSAVRLHEISAAIFLIDVLGYRHSPPTAVTESDCLCLRLVLDVPESRIRRGLH